MLTNAHLAVLSAVRSIRDKTGQSPNQGDLIKYLSDNKILLSVSSYHIKPLVIAEYLEYRAVLRDTGRAGKQLVLTEKGEAALEAVTEVNN